MSTTKSALCRLLAGFFLLAASASALADLETPAWFHQYDGPAGGRGRDEAFDIALHSDGSVAVTGRSWGTGNTDDMVTIRYAPDGALRWSARYDGPVGYIDYGIAVGIDAAGNTYALGESFGGGDYGTGPYYDYVTIKYDAAGNVVWVRRYNGPGNHWDSPQDMVVDAAGNCYIAGFSYVVPTSTGARATHFHVLKYDPDGNIAWQHHLDLTPHLGAGARAIALDSSGNVYAAGITTRWEGGSDDDMMIVKVNPAGQVVYMTTWDGEYAGDALTVACDAAGNAYATGYARVLQGAMYENALATVKLTPTGALHWARTEVFSGMNVAGYGVAADSQGRVYTVGGIANSENWGVVAAYDANGTQLWLDIYDRGPGLADQWMRGVKIGPQDHIYVNVMTEWDQPEVYDFTVFIYAPDGTRIAERRADFGSHSDVAYEFALGDDGSVYFTGYSWSDVTGTDITTAKLAGTAPRTGDMNCDGSVNPFDIQGFVTALGDPAGYQQQYPDCSLLNADTNSDGSVNGFDIQGFVDLLGG